MRIISGSARGRKLEAPQGATRPTSDRAREGVFSTISSLFGELHDLRVLDLYAGTGALGLEAASRGATSVDLIENDPKAVAVCRANVEKMGFSGVHVHALAVEKWLTQEVAPAPYDIVLMDPPYSLANDRVEHVLELLLSAGLLSERALVSVERESKGPSFTWPAGYLVERERAYGLAIVRYASKDC
jgi:16S rRNA (guanine966-N2)-methyltransferase